MLSEHIQTIASLLRKHANHHDGQLQLSSMTTDILLSNLQFLSDDVKRYEDSERGMDVLSPAVLAIIRELVAVTSNISDGPQGCDHSKDLPMGETGAKIWTICDPQNSDC